MLTKDVQTPNSVGAQLTRHWQFH